MIFLRRQVPLLITLITGIVFAASREQWQFRL